MNFFTKKEKDIINISEENKTLGLNLNDVLDEAIEHFSTVQAKSINLLQRGIKTKEEFYKEVERYFINKKVPKDDVSILTERFIKYIDGYHILEELINDETISDIKILAYDNIRVKRNGKRESTNLKFKNEGDLKRFTNLVAIKNRVNLSYINASQKFTDKDSNDKFRLRFNISTEYINSVDTAYIHVRKIPKTKYTEQDLINLGVITKEQIEYLKYKLKNGDVIIFTGHGGSGKTTVMNFLIDEIPHNKAGLIIQENEELFSYTHPELMFQHIVSNKGEGKIEYTLKDLAINGLLIDIDYFGIGEIKGGEAMYFLIAANTGHKAITSVHGNSSTEALNKLVDYMTWESKYTPKEIKKMFKYMDITVCDMKDFSVKEISNLIGYDEDKDEFIYNIEFKKDKKAC